MPLSTCTLCKQKSYISKDIQPIFEIFASARRCWGWAFGRKVSGAQVFYFCNGKVRTWRIDNIWYFAAFNLYTVPAKILYLQRYSIDFRNLCLSSKIWRWPFGWKVSGAHVFCFCNGKVKTWRIDNIWNFPTFNLYTVPAKILYLERYSGDFRNLRLISKMWTVAIWLKSFRCARILLLQWQGERLCIDNIWNFATFNLYTVQAEILYLQRYTTNFRNLRVSSKMLKVGIWLESFRCAGILLLQWQGENLAHRQHLKFCHVQPVHCASKNPISPKVFNRFSESLPQLEDVDDGHLGGKFQVRMYFAFAMARWKLGASTIFEIFPLSTCTLCQQKSYISKGIQAIFEIFASSRRCGLWQFGWKVSGAHAFYFCNGKVNVCASTTFEILLLSTCTLCKQKSYISKDIQPIFEIFASARR